jgi:hypothetical protein
LTIRLTVSISSIVGRNIDGPELRADAALVEPGHVGHQRVLAAVRAAGQPLDAQAVILAQLLGDVVVAVDQRRRLQDAVDPGLDGGVDRLRGCGGRREEHGAAGGQDLFHGHTQGFRKRSAATQRSGACARPREPRSMAECPAKTSKK